ncbi:hypothetical protein GF326_10810 [Candidatus Bathyarchaeota archaeon]|nr:hypothetical protein [Candidatus Bathyarchaeota archaeon]
MRAYLEKRIAQGERLEPGSAVIAYKKGYGDTGYRDVDRQDQHVTRKTLTKEIRTAVCLGIILNNA